MVDVLGSVACSTLLVRKRYFVAKFPVQVAKITDNLTFTHHYWVFSPEHRLYRFENLESLGALLSMSSSVLVTCNPVTL
jgi:hypothetical protein